ncbi:MAG TPA: PQQ-dependent sugar dehydrogenase, partial [Anseongella sp.]|nr:PQQ-dependent sugar dehydrogenase [Anseongella sp.]
MKNVFFPLICCIVCFLSPSALFAQKDQEISQSIEGHIFRPRQLTATAELIGSLQLPPGFVIEKFAEGLGKPRMLAVAGNGSVYVTDRENGTLTLLQDQDGDGRAEIKKILSKKEQLHGIALSGDTLYLTTVKEVYRTTLRPDGGMDSLRLMAADLPDGGQHGNRTLGIGPGGELYVSVGSTCNSCAETNKENATLLKMNRDGRTRTIFAKGLRNTIGFDWHPQTGELWGFDHGIDWLGDHEQQEELNKLEEGKGYGWPFVYADGKFDLHHEPKSISLQPA